MSKFLGSVLKKKKKPYTAFSSLMISAFNFMKRTNMRRQGRFPRQGLPRGRASLNQVSGGGQGLPPHEGGGGGVAGWVGYLLT